MDFERRFALLLGPEQAMRPAARALVDHLLITAG
jgi:hypothetical protein